MASYSKTPVLGAGSVNIYDIPIINLGGCLRFDSFSSVSFHYHFAFRNVDICLLHLLEKPSGVLDFQEDKGKQAKFIP